MPQTTESTRRAAHLKKLSLQMAPDPAEWEFTGRVIDDPSMSEVCACGHPIRYIFLIRRARDGKRLNIGSTCIAESVPHLIACGAAHLATSLQDANDAFKKEIRQRQKDAREARASEDAQTLHNHARACARWYEELWANVFLFCQVNGISRPPFRTDYFYRGEWQNLKRPENYLGHAARAKLFQERIRQFEGEARGLKGCVERAGCGGCWTDPPVLA